MLQIFHQRRKGTLGAAFLALLLVVSAWPCPQKVEAEGEKNKSPRVVLLNEAATFKDRTSIEKLGISSASTSDLQKLKISDTGTELVDYDKQNSVDFLSFQKLESGYLAEMATLLNDYRKLAGISDSQVKVDAEFQPAKSEEGKYSPQKLAFINMYMGMSAGAFGHNYSKATDLVDAIEAQKFSEDQIVALRDGDHIYNKNNLLMDGSFSKSTLDSSKESLQNSLIQGWNDVNQVHLFNFANGSPLDYKTARGPIGGWIQEGYDYKNNTEPEDYFNLGHRSILLNNDLKELHIGAALGYTFKYGDYKKESKKGEWAHYSAAGWVENKASTRISEQSASVIAFPAPGVFPSEFINPQCTVWTLELDPEVYEISDEGKLHAEIREYPESKTEGAKQDNRICDINRKHGRQILGIKPPASQTGESVPQGKANSKDFPSVYNLAPLEGKTYVVTLTGVKDAKTGEDITIQYWVQYRLINSLPENSDYYLSKEKAEKISKWISKTLIKSGSSETQPSEPTTKQTTEPTTEPSTTPTLPAPRPTDDSSSKGSQLPPPPAPGGSSSKYGRWNQWNKDGKDDEDDDESDTLFGSKYSRNRGPQSQQLRFQGPMAAPQGPGNQFPAGQLSGQPSPMPLAPQNMGQGVNPQGVNQAAMPQAINAPVAANNALQYVPETGEQGFQPLVLGALLGAVALVLAKRRKF